MDIKIKVRPTVYKDISKHELIRKITRNHVWSISNSGIGYTRFNIRFNRRDDILVYNLEKHNTKVEQIRYKTGPKKGRTKKSNVLRKSHWVAYVYEFSPELLKLMKKKVRQGTRTFIFEDIK